MTFSEILQKEKEIQAGKLREKVPQWAGYEIEIPESINLEQCSSSSTAIYKSSLIEGNSIADLTGGLGVDCWAFSRKFGKIFYNDRNSVLAEAVRANFSRLGCDNVEVSALEAEEFLGTLPEVDWIYADPARRDGCGKKVFLLEECSPDILRLQDRIFGKAPAMLVKLSPMADITMLVRRFGGKLQEVHVVGNRDEVKEILCIVRKDWNGSCRIIATDLENTISSSPEELEASKAEIRSPEEGMFLFEPAPALMKAGFFNILGLPRIAVNSHLYLSADCHGFGKNYRIIEVLPFSRKSIDEVAKKYPHCEVSCRNIPVRSEELRKKMGVSSGDDAHIFATADSKGNKLLIICQRVL